MLQHETLALLIFAGTIVFNKHLALLQKLALSMISHVQPHALPSHSQEGIATHRTAPVLTGVLTAGLVAGH